MIISELDDIVDYDANRYEGWSFDRIIPSLRGSTLTLLKRGSMAVVLARREFGGLAIAACKLLPTLKERVAFFREVLDLNYSDVCKHMRLWVFWPLIEKIPASVAASHLSCLDIGDYSIWRVSFARLAQKYRLIRRRPRSNGSHCRPMWRNSGQWSRTWNSKTVWDGRGKSG